MQFRTGMILPQLKFYYIELTDEQIIEHERIQASTVHLNQRNVYNEAFAIMKRSVELTVGDEE